MGKLIKRYKITSSEGGVTTVSSLNSFAAEVGIYYGQFYTALHKGTETAKGGYKVERYTEETSSQPKTKKVTPKKMEGTLEKSTPAKKLEPLLTKDTIFLKEGELEVLDVIQEGNTHRVKVRNFKNVISTRKLTFKRVDNLNGVKCNFSSHLIPKGELYAEVNMDRLYKLSVNQLAKLGYNLEIDFDFNTKVVEKKVEIFTPTLLEETWLLKQETVIKEIKATQTKLAKLRELKDYIGRNVASVKNVNNDLGKVDDMMKKLF